MPRTRGPGRRSDPNTDPLKRYTSLAYADQYICWNYYQFTATQGAQGWNPTESGSVYHQRSSAYLLRLGSGSWFRHKANSMVTLAQAFAALNEAPPEPVPPPDARRSTEAGPPQFPTLVPTAPTGRTMNSPRPSTPTAGSNYATPQQQQPAAAQGNESSRGLNVPTSFGMYKDFNYTTRKVTTKMLIRLILHNGISPQDVVFEWIAPRQLKLRIAWPDWFQMAEQMAQFTLDDHGTMIFPPQHPLTMDTSERNQQLVEEDNRIWDEGFLDFEQDMNTDDPSFEILDVTLPAQNTSVKVLQIYAEVAPEELNTTRLTVSKRRTVNIGAGPRPAPDRARGADQAGLGDRNGNDNMTVDGGA